MTRERMPRDARDARSAMVRSDCGRTLAHWPDVARRRAGSWYGDGARVAVRKLRKTAHVTARVTAWSTARLTVEGSQCSM